jgi:hypothetical protein
MVEMRNVYKIFVTDPEGKRIIGGPGHKWVDNIKIEGTVCENVNWTQLAQDKRMMVSCENSITSLGDFFSN